MSLLDEHDSENAFTYIFSFFLMCDIIIFECLLLRLSSRVLFPGYIFY